MRKDSNVFLEPIALGYSCETKYQISRVAKSRLYPKQSEMAFRFAIRQPDHASAYFGWRLFDWQNTPLETVCTYLERDFSGVYEMEDLELTFDYGLPLQGGFLNRRFSTVHLHEFPIDASASEATLEQIARQFPIARRMFDRLVEDFRRLLTLPGPYLYTVAHPTFPDATVLERLIKLLSERSPDHRFEILVIGRDGYDSDLSSLGAQVTKAWRPLSTGDKPPQFAWEGDDASWDRALAPFSIGFHPLGFHDPGSAQPVGADPPTSNTLELRAPHPNFPTSDSKVVWEKGPTAVYTYDVWRNAGAQLEIDGRGAAMITPSIAWHYSHGVNLDLQGLDPSRHRAWVRVRVAEVAGGPLLASLYDMASDEIGEESLVDQSFEPVEVVLKVRDARKAVLLFRTGADAKAATARLLSVQLLVDEK